MTGMLVAAATANADAPVYVAQNVAFGIIAAMMIYSAVRLVTTANVVHAASYLVMVLAGAAAQFILLGAEFVAITQVLVYIGAIVVLFLFGIMLTKSPMDAQEKASRDNWKVAAGVGVVMLGVLIYGLLDGFGRSKLPADLAPTRVETVSDAIFSSYLVPFEAISLLLLAAAIGAIVISKRD
ncbi:MAG: NADH-quinone oxidoreductase subunit J [Aquihabitans sp.]